MFKFRAVDEAELTGVTGGGLPLLIGLVVLLYATDTY
jgi:hypothetical protein